MANRVDFASAAREAMEQNKNIPPDRVESAVKMTAAIGKVASYCAPIFSVIAFLVIAGVLLLAFRLFGGEGNFKQAFLASEYYNFPCFMQTVPDFKSLIANDPNAKPADKYKILEDSLEWATNVGYPGPANAAEGEVFATFVLPQMMAKAAMGQLSAKDAVAQAETQINAIYKKWRDQGLIGGA